MKRLDVAIIGCGVMGARHAAVIAAHEDCRIAAVLDVHPERAREVAARCGAEARDQMPDGVDVVVVATPARSHAIVALGPVAAGQWVLVEKPLAATLEEARSLVAPRVGVGHSERFHPALRGLTGPCDHFASWRSGTPTRRGHDVDVALDLAVHDLDLVRSLVDDSVSVCTARRTEEDGLVITLAGKRGTADVHVARAAATRRREIRLHRHGEAQLVDLLTQTGPDALTVQWQAFVDAVRGRAPIAVPAEDGAAAVALAITVMETAGG